MHSRNSERNRCRGLVGGVTATIPASRSGHVTKGTGNMLESRHSVVAVGKLAKPIDVEAVFTRSEGRRQSGSLENRNIFVGSRCEECLTNLERSLCRCRSLVI